MQQQPYALNLSPHARAWVENYKPVAPSGYENFVSSMIGSVQKTRPATLEKDRFLLECLAEQCDRQEVRFPKKVFIAQTHLPNAAYLPMTHSFMATSNIMEVMKPNELRAVIGHEVGHGRQGGWLMLLNIAAGILGSLLVTMCLPNLYRKNAAGEVERTPRPQGKDIGSLTTRFFRNGFVREMASWYGITVSMALVQRQFESDADRRGAIYTSPQDMADALKALGNRSNEIRQAEETGKLPSRQVERTLNKLLMPVPNHPSLESRVEKLERMTAERRAIAMERSRLLAPAL